MKPPTKPTSAPLPAAKGKNQRAEALRANLSRRKQQTRARDKKETE
jgi:hypothetical protein